MKKPYQQFVDLLLRWNQKINLISSTDPEEIRVKHIEDSLSLLPLLQGVKTLLDLGSGAGFPGIPLKIECPDLQVTLLEATRKKGSFLLQAISLLQLEGIQVVCGRVELNDIINKTGKFDVVVSRATWALKDFLPMALPYCHAHSSIIAMKGAKWQEELMEAKDIMRNLHLEVVETKPYRLKHGELRCLVKIERIS